MIKVVNLIGINDENKVIVEHNRGVMSKLSLRIEGNGGVLYKLDNNAFDVSMIVFGGEKLSLNVTLSNTALLFNSICMAEGNKNSLHQLSDLLSRTTNPIINHPDNVLLTARDTLVDSLKNIKEVINPECFKITPISIQYVKDLTQKNKLSFPFLFRPCIEHGLQTLVRIDSLDDMEKLHRYAFDGRNEFYITQFINYSSEDSIYRKMRFLIIGDEIIPRHLILSLSWQIHAENKKMDSRLKEKQIGEEIDFLRSIDLSVGKRLLEIKDRLGLEYFGVDCGLDKKGNMIIFEANPFSMVGVGKDEEYHRDNIEHTYHALSRLIVSMTPNVS